MVRFASAARVVLVGGVLLAVCAGAAALALTDVGVYARLGLPVPAVSDRVWVTVLRILAELGAAVAVGSLVFAAFVVPPQPSGVLDVDGYLAVRRAGWSALVAGFAAVLLAPAIAADQSGSTPATVLGGDWWALFATLQEPMAWLLSGCVLLVVGVCGVLTLRWRVTPLLLVGGLVAVVMPPVVGQAANGAGHDWATDAAIVQSLAAAIGTGVLLSLVAHLRRGGPHRALALRRGRRAVVVAGAALVASGAVLVALWMGSGPLLGTGWGLVASARLVLLVVAGAAGAVLWRRRPTGAAAVLLAAAVGSVGLGVVLTRWVPPLFLERAGTAGEALVGYDLPDPVTASRLLLDWRFNILFGTAAIVLAAGYLLGVRRLVRRGDSWSHHRTAAWLCGCAALLLATSSGLGRYSPGLFSVHMISHMMLNMLVPVLFVLGGPVTLLLRALRPAGRGNPPGLREWIVAATGSRFARLATHPLPMLVLFVGSFYVLYLTGLFDVALRYHWAHQLMNLHFLVVGYLFFWPLVGADPAPSRLPHLGRLAVVLAAMPFHAFFGITVMSTSTVLGGEFYRLLGLPWVGGLLDDQHVGGGIAWAAGELPMLLVILALVNRWSRDDAREAARHDRRADADGESDLAAYNAMLARMAGSERG